MSTGTFIFTISVVIVFVLSIYVAVNSARRIGRVKHNSTPHELFIRNVRILSCFLSMVIFLMSGFLLYLGVSGLFE